jgi:hypothetical protein
MQTVRVSIDDDGIKSYHIDDLKNRKTAGETHDSEET